MPILSSTCPFNNYRSLVYTSLWIILILVSKIILVRQSLVLVVALCFLMFLLITRKINQIMSINKKDNNKKSFARTNSKHIFNFSIRQYFAKCTF
uniref:Uncharacterized protein n=1 Tax=Arundo donax TaxID=35708 RepID=A0A0A8XRZ0_ARUDO